MSPNSRRICRGSWSALFIYVNDTVLVNANLLSLVESQSHFRELLFMQLLELESST